MKIYHLNCGSMCPICQKLINGTGRLRDKGFLPCHCLLIENQGKLALVDTGFGIEDVQQSQKRLGKVFPKLVGAQLDIKETAYQQIKALGLSTDDVTDIFPTHLDLDHAGGLSDFPKAKVHIYQPELQSALNPRLKDRLRYRKAQFKHHIHWQNYQHSEQMWFGLPAFKSNNSLDVEIWLVPLVGHTYGHVGIAIKQQNKWLLHCGDAYFHHSQIGSSTSMPPLLKWFEKQVQTDANLRKKTLHNLKHLKANYPEIDLFCAHDPYDFHRFKNI